MTKPLHLPDLIPTLQHQDHIALFLDYDGTLVPYQPQPTGVTTPPLTQRLLTRLTHTPTITLTIITGRTLTDITTKTPTTHLNIAALHGRDITLQNGTTYHATIPPPITHLINAITTDATSFHEPGLLIEHKPDAIAFHYRQVPTDRQQTIIDEINLFIQLHDPECQLEHLHGAQVIELRPKGWTKGTAVTFILATLAQPCPPLPIYIGDDTTDEDAFTTLNDNGITIRVLNNTTIPTAAHYTLNTPADVLFFLEFLTTLKTTPIEQPPQQGG